jgi:hypothetical protein
MEKETLLDISEIRQRTQRLNSRLQALGGYL